MAMTSAAKGVKNLNQIRLLEGREAEDAVKQLKMLVALSPGRDGAPKVDFLKQNNYAIAPIVHSGTLTQDILKKIFAAAQTTGHTSMTAVGLYSPDEHHCYNVPMLFEAVDKLRGTACGVVNFALYAGEYGKKNSWLVLFDSQLYIGYGSEPFVQALVGDIETAYDNFRSTIDGLIAEAKGDVPGYVAEEITRVSNYLGSTLTQLNTGYPNAQEGEMVNIISH